MYVSVVGKKLIKQQHLLHVSSQHGELWPTNGWDWLLNLVHRANFNAFCVLVSLLHGRRSTEVNQTLHDVWPSPGLVHYVYICEGTCPPNGILPGAKFTLHPSLAFSYISSITARHSSSACQPNCVACFSRAATTWYFWWRRGIAVTSLGVSTKLLYVGPG